MNISLIYPPINAPVPAKSTLLGLGYLASVLRNRGHYVSISDLTLEKKEINIHYKQGLPDVIGVSSMFTDYKKDAIDFIISVKNTFPKIHVIVGGAHASTFPEEMMEYADTVIVGEGEEVICDVVEHKRKGIIRAERIRDLDKLPMPAWDLMRNDMVEINKLSSKSPFLMRRPLAHIITSRGCPNNCAFCAVKVAWGRQWIPRSAGNVVDEIEHLYKLGYREIHFNDDNCSINRERMYQICDHILIRGIDVKIACPTGIHIMTLNKPLLKLMKRAGFYRLCFGIETGSPETQRDIHKNIDLDKAKQVIKDANDLGYWTSATFILGFPKENGNKELMRKTLQFPSESKLDFPIFYQWNPQPKTELYEEVRKNRTLIYAPNQLKPVLDFGYKAFVLYKATSFTASFNILKKLRSWEDLKFALGLFWFFLTKIVFKKSITNENIRGRK